MSGGHWNYLNDHAADEIFGYSVPITYGITHTDRNKYHKIVMRCNPLDDMEISAIVYDVFCLLHSYDWAVSGDTDMERYQADVDAFKTYWFQRSRTSRIQQMIDAGLDNLRQELYKTFIGNSGEPPVP